MGTVERMFGNRNLEVVSASRLKSTQQAHLCRASLEGIAFAFAYGFSSCKDKVQPKVIRTGNDNMFQSEIFSTT